MKKWKQRVFVALVALIALGSSSINAQEYYDDCCDTSCCFGGFEVGADVLWWKPCVDDLDYAATGATVINVNETTTKFHYHTICADWQPGFRLRAGLPNLWCSWELLGSYTWINSKDKSSATQPDNGIITNTFLHPEINNAFSYTKTSARWDTTYNSFDALLGHPINLCENQTWKPSFGLAAVVLDQEITTKNSAPELTDDSFGKTKWDSCYWGVGLKAATEYRYELCEGFGLIAGGSASILAGEADNKNNQVVSYGATPDVTKLEFKDSKGCHLLPGYSLLAGLSYNTCVCSKVLGLRIGYEFVKWHNVPNPRRFFIPDSQINGYKECVRSTSNSVTTLGFHGLFAGLDFSF